MFGIADYGAFCVAILVFLALPGPGVFALLGSTAKGGLRGAVSATLGVIMGDQILLWLAVAGVAALLAAHPNWFHMVQYTGAGYLAWLGAKLLWPRGEGESASPIRIEPRRYLRQALFITLLNPKAIVFYMAFFPLFMHPESHPGLPVYMAMAATIAAITAVYSLALCSIASVVAKQVRAHRRAARWCERLTGVFLIGFSLRLVRN